MSSRVPRPRRRRRPIRAQPARSAGLLASVNSIIVLLSSVALVIAALVLTYSVASRYFLHLSTDWQDELSVFLIVGAVFMSAASIQAKRGHIGIEAIVGLLSPRVNSLAPVRGRCRELRVLRLLLVEILGAAR